MKLFLLFSRVQGFFPPFIPPPLLCVCIYMHTFIIQYLGNLSLEKPRYIYISEFDKSSLWYKGTYIHYTDLIFERENLSFYPPLGAGASIGFLGWKEVEIRIYPSVMVQQFNSVKVEFFFFWIL